ncbi:TnsD family Tn7-like transposition protein [Clostridium perfringens]
MLAFFPTPYEDEILYSVCSRYHMRIGNINSSTTMSELFGENYLSSKLLFPTSLNYLANNIASTSDFNGDVLLKNNTPYNYFKSFLQEERRTSLINAMLSDNGINASLYAGLGKDISMFKYLRFCPECLKADIKNYGEGYWHNIHQIPGVLVCPHHKIPTEDSNILVNDLNKSIFGVIDEDYCKNTKRTKYDERVLNNLFKISTKINECLKLENNINLKAINEIYKDYLIYKGYMHPSGRLYREKIVIDFNNYFSEEVLRLLNYEVILEKKTSWFFRLLKNPTEEGNPIRHILLMLFLDIDFDFKVNDSIKYLPFGKGPWYCLNPACNYYKQPVINNIELKFDSRNDNVSANFKCDCGFVYTKHAPYNEDTDKYSYKYILDYGNIWDSKLREMVESREYMLKDIVEYFGISKPAIIRNIKRLALTPNWSSSDKVYSGVGTEFTSRATKYSLRDKHRELWLDKQSENVDISITELIKNNKGTYKWLNKNDREWLLANSPKSKETVPNNIVDWKSRDIEYSELFKRIVAEEMTKEGKPIRITKSYLFRKAKLSNKQSTDLNNIPLTKQFLIDNCESMENYHLRRLKWASNYAFNNGLAQTYSNLFKIASIGDKYYLKYKREFEE